MKILMTADTVGGVWTYSLELARALRTHDVEITLATMGKRLFVEQRRECEALPHVTLCESEFKLEWMEDPWGDVDAAGEWLLRIARELQPDVIHLNGYAHAALPWNAPKVVVCHSCVLSWWLAVHGRPAPEAEWHTYRDRVTQGLRAADYVVAPSRAMLASVKKLYLKTNRLVGVIPNGRSAESFAPAEKAGYVFTAGRLWDKAKNASAMRIISPQIRWPIYAAGDDSLSDVPERLKHSDNYHSLGRLPTREMAAWLSTAAIYCLPARYEPFGLSVLEAALSGCALVLGDIPSLRENWHGAAIFVRPDDHTRTISALNELIQDAGYREIAARRARARGLQFTPERMAQEYMAVYQQLSRNANRAHPKPREVSACAS